MNSRLYNRLQKIRQSKHVLWNIIERDYILSWILAGIGRVPLLRETLVFKGGTALKKCYFGNYRFSEDLDFSAIKGVPKGDDMEHVMSEACHAATELLHESIEEPSSVEIACHRYVEKRPHPERQEAFNIRIRLPWHKYPLTTAKVEVSMDEKILRPVQKRKIIHEYGEELEADIMVYSLEEVIAEKLCAALQHSDKIKQRGWTRSRARDYYDIWRILNTYENELDYTDFGSFLRKKCANRGMVFSCSEDFFQDDMLDFIKRTWVKNLTS